MRGVICQKPSDLAEKLTSEPETDIRHCAASPELWARSGPAAARRERSFGLDFGRRSRPIAAFDRALLPLRHGPSFRIFAAGAKLRRRRTGGVRTFLPFGSSARFALQMRKSSGTESEKRLFLALAKDMKLLWESCKPALELRMRDGKVPCNSWTIAVNKPQPSDLNWFDIAFG